MTDRSPADRPLSIDQAAEVLGLSPEAVRSRLRRGTLAGDRVGRSWLVWLTGRPESGRPLTGERSAGERSTDRPAPPVKHTEAPRESALVAELRADVAFLRAELERRDAELEREQAASAELRRLLAMHMPALVPATAAQERENGPVTAKTTGTSPAPERRPWWRFWGSR